MIFNRFIKACFLALGIASVQHLALAQIGTASVARPAPSAPAGAPTPAITGELGLSLPGAAEQGAFTERAQSERQGSEMPTQALDRSPLPSIGTTQFQSYVEGLSGKKVPLFGYNLFGSRQFGAADNLPAPGDYLVGPGDTIELRVWGGLSCQHHPNPRPED
ncbi:MAG: polysaccharide biosynthesis/export family protein, partial [Burkholderiales bacterium]|nr:polysaccharide biosynthesis/export family protein [Burkholderiales bacterium]